MSKELGLPVALKVLSEDISHKSDVGGVVLDLVTPEEVHSAAEHMAERVAQLRPDAKLTGFTVQQMARRPEAHELIVGVATDPIFGPIVLFGEGGTGVEVIADKAVTLPPLNMKLARELIGRTRVYRRLEGYRDRRAADTEAVCLTLLKVAQLVTDIAEIAELDINPLFADHQGVIAVDARIRVTGATVAEAQRLAIRPYPKELEQWIELDGQKLLLRPIRPEDEPQHKAFLDELNMQDIRFRFFGQVRNLPHSQLARFTQIDYNREMAFIATGMYKGEPKTLGVVRAVSDPDNVCAEFAIVVSSKLKGRGLGKALLSKMIDYCRDRGTRELAGEVLAENERMLKLAKRLGFETHRLTQSDVIGVHMKLDGTQGQASTFATAS